MARIHCVVGSIENSCLTSPILIKEFPPSSILIVISSFQSLKTKITSSLIQVVISMLFDVIRISQPPIISFSFFLDNDMIELDFLNHTYEEHLCP